MMDLMDGGSANAWGVACFLKDVRKISASDARIAVRKTANLGHQLADNPSGSFEWMLDGKEIAWRTGTLTNLSDQLAARMSLAGDSAVAFAFGHIFFSISLLDWMLFVGIAGFVRIVNHINNMRGHVFLEALCVLPCTATLRAQIPSLRVQCQSSVDPDTDCPGAAALPFS
jgi:hypothetical protein